ncbi:SRPBCC family protein [Falsiroseomonas selenitidurans]|uniref:SRPBCC domain-containing protein n=1 Tax=Falsiroseomonas selenitidurans TaxID=2716335 RepID=A0ABX1EHG7_9PROT|nr:SRPBCC domain-containing protein [Falsiroseomonas selenitidurans]NKC34300.1 SRPBCC domain-containing protein [Falsiroseomonas selenitidurans]
MTVTIPSLTLVRRIRATPARAFAAWTEAEMLGQWFGPHHTRVEEAAIDPRPGGSFRIVLREEGGARHEIGGRYLVVEPEQALTFTWAWASAPERESRVTIRFRPLEDGTELTLTHDRFADADTATRHRRGWTESMQRLAAIFATTPEDTLP